MKSKSIKALKFSKNSVSNLSSILGGIDGESEPSGEWNAAPSTGGPSWNCDSIEVCTR
jgi:hypothetical protein